MSVTARVATRISGPGSASIPRQDFAPIGPGNTPINGNIQFLSVELDRVFPVLYKYYDAHPIGRATVRNEGNRTVSNIEVQRFARNTASITEEVNVTAVAREIQLGIAILTALNALLEAVGVETAFITVPGAHLYRV